MERNPPLDLLSLAPTENYVHTRICNDVVRIYHKSHTTQYFIFLFAYFTNWHFICVAQTTIGHDEQQRDTNLSYSLLTEFKHSECFEKK